MIESRLFSIISMLLLMLTVIGCGVAEERTEAGAAGMGDVTAASSDDELRREIAAEVPQFRDYFRSRGPSAAVVVYLAEGADIETVVPILASAFDVSPEQIVVNWVDAAGTPTPTPTPAPPASGVLTEADRRAQYEQWPDDYKLTVNDEVVVLYTNIPNSTAMWAGLVLINHLPSGSQVVLYPLAGSPFHYESEVGREALEAVLANDAVMQRILDRVPVEVNERKGMFEGAEIVTMEPTLAPGTEACPPRPSLNCPDEWPEEYRLALDDETVALFTYRHPLVDWDQHTTILHLPSDSRAVIAWNAPEDTFAAHVQQDRGTPEGRAHLEALLADSAVVQHIQDRIREIWTY